MGQCNGITNFANRWPSQIKSLNWLLCPVVVLRNIYLLLQFFSPCLQPMKSGNKQWWPGCFYNTFICSYNLDLHDLQCISTLIDKHILLIVFLTDFHHFTVNCARWCSRIGGPQWWLCCFINLMKYIYHKPWNLVPHCFLGVNTNERSPELQSSNQVVFRPNPVEPTHLVCTPSVLSQQLGKW